MSYAHCLGNCTRCFTARYHKTTKADVARAYGALFGKVYSDSKKPGPRPEGELAALLEVVTGRDSPAYFPKSQTRKYMSRGETDSFGGKVQELDKVAVHDDSVHERLR